MLLISDLHLDPSRPDITEALDWFLREKAPSSGQLYVLGDLFEVWLGDDAPDPLADHVAARFHALAEQGVAIYLMHGNRDFLIGEAFARRCGAQLVEEPLVLTVADKKIGLLHGDVLCTRDTEYLKFRGLVRNPQWQAAFLAQPLQQRQEFARQARAQSKQATASAAAEIMDVTPEAVMNLFRQLDIDTLIHGHTHRPAVHEIAPADSPANRIARHRVVLGDWDRQGWFGQIDGAGAVTLHNFPFSSSESN